ncbi:LysR substrate-binding domain-containing protein [Paenibacillus sp. TRM 82003]|uniref:LysR substrate-binding domain-containing protein n=1 Tax=Kineococcus sp. TRM81007 TaxID=2925831 RepID=UPI001F5A343D|nr:LysR substrate-binding domain-containing protein [Kineococcus sp. TRM81007]MCI2237420.1 LysR substrate-binding domain-containing protein [Kineococcus sp. TRM81007]MCI3919771.1 LysR substrate-binding domain-containing protein [Paenibacillus sp. TRM 82003]
MQRAEVCARAPGRAHTPTRPLLEQPLVPAVPADHRLAGRERLALGDVAGEDLVLFEHGYGLREAAEAGIVPRVAFEGQDADTVRGLVAAGPGVALPPAPASPRPDGVELPLTGPSTSRTVGLVWREGDLPRVAAAFRDVVVAHPDLLGGAAETGRDGLTRTARQGGRPRDRCPQETPGRPGGTRARGAAARTGGTAHP